MIILIEMVLAAALKEGSFFNVAVLLLETKRPQAVLEAISTLRHP
jgi:hypothetical protein